MKYCSKHHENPDDAVFCSECGEKLKSFQVSKSQKCPSCSANNPQDAMFCHYCGYKFSETIKPHQKVELTQETANSARQASKNSTYQTSKKYTSSDDDTFSIGFFMLILGIIFLVLFFWIGSGFSLYLAFVGIVSGIGTIIKCTYKYLKDHF